MKLKNPYPKAHENRISGHDPKIHLSRHKLLKAAAQNFFILQILFLCLFAYIFGAIWQQGRHVHDMNILFVDYDGGVLGQAVRDASKGLKSDNFPELQERDVNEFESPRDMREAVCKTKFWAAVYTSAGASERLADALSGGEAASSYNRSDVLTFIWNEAKYPTVVDASIQGSMTTLSSASRIAYTSLNGTGALTLLNTTSATAISIFANPWTLQNTNIQVTTQGSRLIYNTLVVILIMIQEFFYLGTINGLYAQFKIYANLYPHRIILYRNFISLAYTLCGSLCVAGAIWAFRSSWHVNGNQFALTWAVLWLFAHVNFLWLDVFTIWTPPQYVPMLLIMWIVFNITSILVPFELAPGFYRWSFVMPAHEVYQVLTDIWSGGCNPQLYYALPILFAEEVLGLALGVVGVYRRCHFAVLAEKAADAAFKDRVAAAMRLENRILRERRQSVADGSEGPEEEKREEREAEETIRGVDKHLQRQHTRAAIQCRNGFEFPLAFNKDVSESSLSGTEV